MLCTFCPPTTLGDFYIIPEKLPKSSADKMYRACETKDQTLKKIKTHPLKKYITKSRFSGYVAAEERIS